MIKHREQYACFHIKDFPVQAMLRLRPSLHLEPCVVLEGTAPLQQVCSLNANAVTLGAICGMTQSEVETVPGIQILHRSQVEELSARAVLLECAWSISPRVEAHSRQNALWIVIDITGTVSLHGPLDSQLDRLMRRVAALGFICTIAMSCNYHAAVCLAQGLTSGCQSALIPPGLEKETLSPLALDVLDISSELIDKFHTWGIRTLGLLAALPERELIARLGQEGERLTRLASGNLHHHFRPIEPDIRLAESMELDSPVTLLDSLLFVIGSMLDQLILRAVERILSLASVSVFLTLENGQSHRRTITPALPAIDRKLWLKLIHLALESDPPTAAILAIHMSCETGTPSTLQLGLFSPQTPEANRLDVTLARIRSIVGDASAGSARLENTHKMDSFVMESFHLQPPRQQKSKILNNTACVRRIRPPEHVPVTLQDNTPHTFYFRNTWYRVEYAYGPWLSSGEWWHATLWNHEQWDILALSPEMHRLSCCLLYTPSTATWHLASLYD